MWIYSLFIMTSLASGIGTEAINQTKSTGVLQVHDNVSDVTSLLTLHEKHHIPNDTNKSNSNSTRRPSTSHSTGHPPTPNSTRHSGDQNISQTFNTTLTHATQKSVDVKLNNVTESLSRFKNDSNGTENGVGDTSEGAQEFSSAGLLYTTVQKNGTADYITIETNTRVTMSSDKTGLQEHLQTETETGSMTTDDTIQTGYTVANDSGSSMLATTPMVDINGTRGTNITEEHGGVLMKMWKWAVGSGCLLLIIGFIGPIVYRRLSNCKKRNTERDGDD